MNIYDYNHGSIFNSPKSEGFFFHYLIFFYITFIYYICIRLLLSLLFLAEEGISAKLSIGSFTIAEETMRANKSK